MGWGGGGGGGEEGKVSGTISGADALTLLHVARMLNYLLIYPPQMTWLMGLQCRNHPILVQYAYLTREGFMLQ